MKLALFDLDHTLVPFDSGHAFLSFLVTQGALREEDLEAYVATCQRYVARLASVDAVHASLMRPLARIARTELLRWRAQFEASLAHRVPAGMRALVRPHQEAGDLCAIVTATARFVAEPFAAHFGITALLATESATVDGAPGAAWTGATVGPPCHGSAKVERVNAWLADRPGDGPRRVVDFECSWFYADSRGDLPLLQAVSVPVAVRPDDELLAHARAAGWQVRVA